MSHEKGPHMPSPFRTSARGLRRPIGVGALAGGLTALAVFGGTGAYLAAAQDTPDTTVEAESPDTTITPEQRQAEIEEWRQCMADNGVDLPEPQLDENGRRVKPTERPQLDDAQREALRGAVEACGRPPFHGRGGPGGHLRGGPRAGCDEDGTPEDGTTEDTAPSVEGSSYSV